MSEDESFHNCDVQKVIPGLYIGDQQVSSNHKLLDDLGIKGIVVAGKELSPKFPKQFEYLHIPVRDHRKEMIIDYFQQSNVFIDAKINQKTAVLVHCAMGKSRSVTLAAAYIMQKYGKTANQTLNFLKRKRKGASPNQGFLLQLNKYEQSLKKNKESNKQQNVKKQ